VNVLCFIFTTSFRAKSKKSEMKRTMVKKKVPKNNKGNSNMEIWGLGR